MDQPFKSRARRAEVRRRLPKWRDRVDFRNLPASLAIATLFVLLAALIVMFRPDVVAYRPGQWAPSDIVSRVEFKYFDVNEYHRAQSNAHKDEPHVYMIVDPDPLMELETKLLQWPDRVAGLSLSQVDESIRSYLDNASLVRLQEYAARNPRPQWDQAVKEFIRNLREINFVVLRDSERMEELGRTIRVGTSKMSVAEALAISQKDDIEAKISKPAADYLPSLLAPKVVRFAMNHLGATHTLDKAATQKAQAFAEKQVPEVAGEIPYSRNEKLVDASSINNRPIDEASWRLLRAEDRAFRASVPGSAWREAAGLGGAVVLLTLLLCAYTFRFQPRIAANHARAAGVSLLLLCALLISQLTAMGTSELYLFAVAPTLIAAMILAIAYDQRFALGVGSMLAILVTLATNQGFGFLMIVLSGVGTCGFLLDDVRGRSKLIEVGGVAAVAMLVSAFLLGLLSPDHWIYICKNALYAGGAGFVAGFVTLGILPFIEKAFHITTSMTLLELADQSHPLLRRLSSAAPGSYNHSLQVATLAEEGARAIGANCLLSRVAAYYHDVGKIHKSEYFIENQAAGTQNRHLNLSPSVSLLIILAHVKDGVELAREYNLPSAIVPFIQSHHGTTVVEYFYHQAKNRAGEDYKVEPEHYRYPGPKPRSKEVGVLMLADCCESACRAMNDHSPQRIETLVHDLLQKRLADGQFDECDITMRELELVARSMVRTLIGIYHGRISYPSDRAAETAATRAGPRIAAS